MRDSEWSEVTWAHWCQWIQGKTVKLTVDSYEAKPRELPRGSLGTLIEFTDGTKSLVLSNNDMGWSEVTPGEGTQPPTVLISSAVTP